MQGEFENIYNYNYSSILGGVCKEYSSSVNCNFRDRDIGLLLSLFYAQCAVENECINNNYRK